MSTPNERDQERLKGKPLWERPVRWPKVGLPFDMRPLRFVLAAAERLSFSGAAQVLNTRTSSVSRRVRDFEDELGVALFERTSAGVRLTDAGSRFIAEIVPAMSHVEAALHNAGAAGRVEHGTIRIGIITTLAGGFLRELIIAFREEFKDVRLDIRDGGRRGHLRAIHSRDLDIAFFTGNSPLADCEVLELWQERIHVAFTKEHLLAGYEVIDWPQLREERFIVATHEPGPEVHDYIVRRIADYSTYPEVTSHPVVQETLMHMVSMGEGITLVSEGWMRMTFPALELRPLTAVEDIMPFSAVWSPLNDNPALRRFISFAKVLASKRRNDEAGH